MRGFGSDNHAPIHPEILESIIKINNDHAPSYQTDEQSEILQKKLKDIFGSQITSYLVFNGTAANVLALRTLMQNHESCLVTDVSHLHLDECAAPEFFSGKLIPMPSKNGKFIISELEKKIIRLGDQHFSQVKVISLTQPTELGTVYSIEEMKEISSWAKKHNLKIHIDGSRYIHAAHFLKLSLGELTQIVQADVISFGGTKNGLLFGELVLLMDQKLDQNFKFLRKQSAQLPSKTRFMACQFLAFFNNDLYKKISKHSHQMAYELSEQLKNKLPQLKICYPVQSNSVFVMIPKKWIKPLKQQAFFYIWNESSDSDFFECRLMMSWDTTLSDIDQFVAKACGLNS